MLIEVPRGDGESKRRAGTWMRLLAHTPEPEYRPYWSAIIFCPDCGKPLSCVNHTIAANGQLSPSVGHPDQWMPCGWHTTPRLLGWEPDAWGLPPVSKPETCELCGYVAHTVGGWGTWSGGAGLICATCVNKRILGDQGRSS